ncbi:hypothetical protein ACWCYY_11060 [Kitasatospora sp. NPDC001664]
MHGPDEALALLTPLRFWAPATGGGPAQRSVPEGPLDRQAVAAEAAMWLRDGEWSVDLDPALQGSERSAAALTLLADISTALDDLRDLIGEMDSPGELADVLGQLTIGSGSAMNGIEQTLLACADQVRATTSPGHHDLVDRIRADADRTSRTADNLARWSDGLDALRPCPRAAAATAGSPRGGPAGAAPAAIPSPARTPRTL